jgi:hypothetical protein
MNEPLWERTIIRGLEILRVLFLGFLALVFIFG